MAHTLRIEYVPLDQLAPATRNPKRHDHERLGESIDRLGFIESVVLDERTGRLVGGHGRCDHLAMLRAAGDPPPDGVVLADDGETWLVATTRGWASADDAEAQVALVALNRVGEAGGWDPRGLVELLTEVNGADGGLTGTGYTPNDLAVLLSSVAEPSAPPAFPQPDDEPTFAHRCPRCSFEFD